MSVGYKNNMNTIVLIAHNIRSTYNIGSLLRTADGMGVSKVYLTGFTPYPASKTDSRLPHIADKLNAAIHKTALGAEHTVQWEQTEDVFTVLSRLKKEGFTLCALEQTENAVLLPRFYCPQMCALLLGSEVTGVAKDLLEEADICLEIPMFGKKESFNVVQAAAMALFQLRFH